MTFQQHAAAARARLVSAGLAPDEAAFDAEVLARHVLGWDRATFYSRQMEQAPAEFAEGFGVLIRRRERREPVSQIVGVREFWGRAFEVSPDVLTPRPETELVIEAALAWCGRRRMGRIVDVGTGSGCLAVTLACELPDRPARTRRAGDGDVPPRIVALDLSSAALRVARRNAIRHGVTSRIAFVQSSFLSAIGRGLDLIVANPPYVPAVDKDDLPPEVRDYEPALALHGGADGLDAFRILLPAAADRLTRGAAIIAEFGAGQEPGIRQIVAGALGLEVLEVRSDLRGIPRVVTIEQRRETN